MRPVRTTEWNAGQTVHVHWRAHEVQHGHIIMQHSRWGQVDKPTMTSANLTDRTHSASSCAGLSHLTAPTNCFINSMTSANLIQTRFQTSSHREFPKMLGHPGYHGNHPPPRIVTWQAATKWPNAHMNYTLSLKGATGGGDDADDDWEDVEERWGLRIGSPTSIKDIERN